MTQFSLFVLVGGIAAIANFVSRVFFSFFLNYSLAIFFAYLVGMFVAFILNRHFVFRNSSNTLKKSIFWFVIINLFAVVQTILVSNFFAYQILPQVDMFQYNLEIGHIIGIIFPVFTSYIGHKYLSFRMSK